MIRYIVRVVPLCLVILASLFILSSCKTTSSDPMLMGGVETNLFSEVIPIFIKTKYDSSARCTGFIVSHNTLITTSSCLLESKAVYVNNRNNDGVIYAKKYLTHDKCDSDCIGPYNIGVVVFEDSTFTGVGSPLFVDTRSYSKGTKVRLVGYGCKTLHLGNSHYCDDTDKRIIKTMGTTTTEKNLFCDGTMIQLDGEAITNEHHEVQDVPVGTKVVAYIGDFGGPVLLESDRSKILGVVSYTADFERNDLISSAINNRTIKKQTLKTCVASFNYKENLEFLKKAKTSIGAHILGI